MSEIIITFWTVEKQKRNNTSRCEMYVEVTWQLFISKILLKPSQQNLTHSLPMGALVLLYIVELSSCHRNHMLCRMENIYYLVLYRLSLLTTDLYSSLSPPFLSSQSPGPLCYTFVSYITPLISRSIITPSTRVHLPQPQIISNHLSPTFLWSSWQKLYS